jgi:hypothetical protein
MEFIHDDGQTFNHQRAFPEGDKRLKGHGWHEAPEGERRRTNAYRVCA